MTSARAELLDHARASIVRGSKSFAAASRLFDRTARERVWLLYAWCRACDDLADAQDHGGALGDQSGAQDRLARIRRLTDAAFAGEPTGDPAFDALGLLATETGLTRAMADDVVAGFALDAADWRPASEADMLRYCYHVAGAVGVMMAVVMGVSRDDEDTLDRASDLGIAFQLANIARDIAEDHAAGRCYLPAEWLAEAEIDPGDLLEPQHRRRWRVSCGASVRSRRATRLRRGWARGGWRSAGAGRCWPRPASTERSPARPSGAARHRSTHASSPRAAPSWDSSRAVWSRPRSRARQRKAAAFAARAGGARRAGALTGSP